MPTPLVADLDRRQHCRMPSSRQLLSGTAACAAARGETRPGRPFGMAWIALIDKIRQAPAASDRRRLGGHGRLRRRDDRRCNARASRRSAGACRSSAERRSAGRAALARRAGSGEIEQLPDDRASSCRLRCLIAAALWPTSSAANLPEPISPARPATTFSGVPSSWAMPEASRPTVFKRSAWRSCSMAAMRAAVSSRSLLLRFGQLGAHLIRGFRPAPPVRRAS